jgi:hypothetical protein
MMLPQANEKQVTRPNVLPECPLPLRSGQSGGNNRLVYTLPPCIYFLSSFNLDLRWRSFLAVSELQITAALANAAGRRIDGLTDRVRFVCFQH